MADNTSQRQDSALPVRRAIGLRYRRWYLAFDLAMLVGFLATTTTLLRLVHGAFDRDFAFSALVGITGCSLGLVVAVIITPLTGEEHVGWTKLATALAGVIAGYAIKVFDNVVDSWLKNDRLLDPGFGVRAATFLLCFMMSLAMGFSYRRYYVTLDLRLAGRDWPDQAPNSNPSTQAGGSQMSGTVQTDAERDAG